MQFPKFLLMEKEDLPFMVSSDSGDAWLVFSSAQNALMFIVGAKRTELMVAEFISASDLLRFMKCFRPDSLAKVLSNEVALDNKSIQFRDRQPADKFFEALTAQAASESN